MRVIENGTDYVSLKDEAKKNRSLLANKTKYDLIGKVVDETVLYTREIVETFKEYAVKYTIID